MAARVNYTCPFDFIHIHLNSSNSGYRLSFYHVFIYIYIYLLSGRECRAINSFRRGAASCVFVQNRNLFIVFASHDATPPPRVLFPSFTMRGVVGATDLSRAFYFGRKLWRITVLGGALPPKSIIRLEGPTLVYYKYAICACVPVHKSTNKSFSRFFDRL